MWSNQYISHQKSLTDNFIDTAVLIWKNWNIRPDFKVSANVNASVTLIYLTDVIFPCIASLKLIRRKLRQYIGPTSIRISHYWSFNSNSKSWSFFLIWVQPKATIKILFTFYLVNFTGNVISKSVRGHFYGQFKCACIGGVIDGRGPWAKDCCLTLYYFKWSMWKDKWRFIYHGKQCCKFLKWLRCREYGGNSCTERSSIITVEVAQLCFRSQWLENIFVEHERIAIPENNGRISLKFGSRFWHILFIKEGVIVYIETITDIIINTPCNACFKVLQ